jgi:hypothetical protein
MSMKDLLNKMTELQGAQASAEVVSTTDKKTLNEGMAKDVWKDRMDKKFELRGDKGNVSNEVIDTFASREEAVEYAKKHNIKNFKVTNRVSNKKVAEDTKPSLKGIFNAMVNESIVDEVRPFRLSKKPETGKYSFNLSQQEIALLKRAKVSGGFSHSVLNISNNGDVTVQTKNPKQLVKDLTKIANPHGASWSEVLDININEAEQVTIQPAQQNTQVIKQGDKTLGTVTNPSLANQIKQSIGKGEMSLAGDELQEEGVDTRSPLEVIDDILFDYATKKTPKGAMWRRADQFVSIIVEPDDPEFINWSIGYIKNNKINTIESGNDPISEVAMVVKNFKNKRERVAEGKLTEKAKSKSQQQAAGAALAAKRGDAPKSKLKGASKEMAKMPSKELEKFAKTKHKGLPDKKEKTDEAAMPTHDGDFGAGLGAGRNNKTLEAKDSKTEKTPVKLTKGWGDKGKSMKANYGKVAKPDYIDLDKDGNKKESMKKAAADKQKVSTMKKTNEAKAKSDYIDLDKDGNKTELMKKAAADKKKKTVKEGANPAEAARLLGKAHAMGKDPFACKYEAGTPEAQAYLDGYKEGLDECYGSGGSMGTHDASQDIGMMPGTDSMVSMNDTPSPRGGSEFEVDSFDDEGFGDMNSFGEEPSESDMIAFESWDRQLNALLNEGKMKEIDIDMQEMTATQFKKEYGKTKAEMEKELSGTAKKDKKPVKEGISVSVSKGQQNTPDSVTITAQDSEADALLAMIKQAGLGLFGGDDDQQTSNYGAPVSAPSASTSYDQVDTGDHDSMIALMQKVADTGSDYEDEESDDEHVHGHPDAACDECGTTQCECGTSYEQGKENIFGEDESEDQMEFEVAEAADSEEAETTADEDAEAEEDKALAGADSGDEEEIDESSCSMDEDADSSYPSINGKKVDISSIEVKGGSFNDSSDTYATYAEFIDGSPLDEYELEELSQDGDLMNQKRGGLNEWANDAGYQGSENTEDNAYERDMEFMMNVISGGLNNQKKDQTTLPHTKVTMEDSLNEWKKLSGIK